MSKAKMSNAIARKHFLHAADIDAATDSPACFFSEGGSYGDGDTWGFWVNQNGRVDTDRESSSGEMPSTRVVDACILAAVKYLKTRGTPVYIG